jgi:hypothetical protein
MKFPGPMVEFIAVKLCAQEAVGIGKILAAITKKLNINIWLSLWTREKTRNDLIRNKLKGKKNHRPELRVGIAFANPANVKRLGAYPPAPAAAGVQRPFNIFNYTKNLS